MSVCVGHLENVREVSQVEDVVKTYRCGEEVLADFLMQTDSCLGKQNNETDKRYYNKRMALLCTERLIN